ncbi:MAG: sigma-54-dependent Fis family transcriptional regulator [Alphaproteobacteria bacterium]|nr:sigma-54-dependent Fis family transcriptional regulator [Alphaproteobacteria bacterium]
MTDAPDRDAAPDRDDVPRKGRILVVDDDKAVRVALRVNLKKAGWEVGLATDGEEAVEMLRVHPVDIVLSDVMMPNLPGMQLLSIVRERWPETRVIMMTGHGSVGDAVTAMKAGADDYVIKPVEKEELLIILDKALAEKALRAEVVQLRAEVRDRYGFENLVGVAPAMQDVYELVAAVAESDALVLITGPTGTGKELLAHAIHHNSPRKNAPFVKVNCAALPEGLLESELFGHEKGAFTGAVRQHLGRFEQAEGGTILLDEIGEIPLSTQVKLLRVLQNGEIQRLGSTKTRRVDVRVVAATNRDLRAEVKAGAFREDLYYRLNVFHIPVPPLAGRREDIPLLVDFFIARFAERYKRPVARASAEVLDQLAAHPWPGNVRELEHVIERAVLLCRGEELTRVQLPQLDGDEEIDDGLLPPGTNLPDALADAERRFIVEALKIEKGVQARAARRLGISRSNLNYRISKLDIAIKDVVYE